MNPSKMIYVVGNGFDLHHSLPTNYTDFRNYMISSGKSSTVNRFEEISGISYIESPWSDLEESIGELDWEQLVHHYGDLLPNYSDENPKWHDFEYEINDKMSSISEMSSYISEWISSIDIMSASRKEFTFNDNDLFLSFNYTMVLEKLYGVSEDSILHIHGSIDGEKPVFGHKFVEKLKIDLSEHDNTIFIRGGQENYNSWIERTEKCTDLQLSRHIEFFDLMHDTSNVVLMGHSLGDVDDCYINKIIQESPDAKWTIISRCINPRDVVSNEKRKISKLHNMGVKCVDCCTWNQWQSRDVI